MGGGEIGVVCANTGSERRSTGVHPSRPSVGRRRFPIEHRANAESALDRSTRGATLPHVTPDPKPRRILRFWTGTRPGLERLMLASVPALLLGIFVASRTRWFVGYLAAFALMAAAVFLPRRSSDA